MGRSSAVSRVLRPCYVASGGDGTYSRTVADVAGRQDVDLASTVQAHRDPVPPTMKADPDMSPSLSPILATLAPRSDADAFKLAVEGDGSRPLEEFLIRVFGEDNLVTDTVGLLIEPALQILLVVIFALVAKAIANRVIDKFVRRMKEPEHRLSNFKKRLYEGAPPSGERRSTRADAMGTLMRSIAGAIIWTMAIFSIVAVFGINLAPLIAGAGIIGLAVGFGAQDLVSDFLSGIFMLIEDQYGVGDVIDAGDATGVVESISLRTTRIRDVTGTLWHVPNGEIRRVGNMSQQWARALLDVGVSYDTDVEQASEVILEVANELAAEEEWAPKFLDQPEIWGVQNLGADSVDIRLVIKTTPGDQWATARELRARIKKAFDAASIEIPYPQRTVWLRTDVTGADEAPKLDVGPNERTANDASSKPTKKPTAKKPTTKKPAKKRSS